ncbi:MAG: alpha-galactosidase [Victivallales bacterium]|nr:alpha-galactosidase [Victivallales bacterium]
MPSQGEGTLPESQLLARRCLWHDGPWHCLTWEFTNQGDTPVALGSCHLAEIDELPDSGARDSIYLDSNGGWFSGVVRVTSQMPNMDWEYWREVFCAAEDIAWAKAIQGGDLTRASHYSLGGMSVYLRPSHPALFFGFVVPRLRCTAIPFALNDPTTGAVRRIALVNNFAGYALQPGESIVTETALWREDANPHRLLEEYADLCVKMRDLKLRHDTPPVGWLSWYGYRLEITEEECLRIADFVNREYPGFGFKYFQIDLGYNTQNLPGQWFDTNDHFPNGLAYYCEEIRKRGFTPGVWCAAFCVAESSDFYREHPDAVTRWSGDAPGRWFWEPKDPLYYLDPTHPAAQEFIAKVLNHFKEAGAEYFKIDFMNRLGRVDHEFQPHDAKIVKGTQAYRIGCEALVKNLAPTDYLYSCSNLLFDSVGYASTSMTACDIANTGVRQALAEGDDSKLKFYRMQFATTMARYYIHKKFLLLNPDGICIAPPADCEEAWFRTLFVGMSGGQVFLGDRFDLAEPAIRDYVKRVLPPYGEAARPVDLFRKPYPDGRPEILHLHTPQREVVGLFNFDNKKAIELNWQELGLEGCFEAWEFYERKYLGVLDTSQPFAYPMPFPSARALLLTPISDRPQVIATTFHFTGGAVELKDISYDLTTNSLSGKLIRPNGDAGSIYIKVSRGLTCDLPQIAPGIVELHLIGTGTPLDWEVHFTPT